MFNIFNRRHRLDSYALLGVDLHSHLLPAIDDGSRGIADSLRLLKGMAELGFGTVHTTPHVSADRYPNTPQSIGKALTEVLGALRVEGSSLVVSAAAEYLLDEGFDTLMREKALLKLPGHRVLVEMPFLAPVPHLDNVVFRLQVAGYQPVMAHPERYSYWPTQAREWHRIRKLGCELQVNLLSFCGYYGEAARKSAYRLVQDGLVTFAATDLHNTHQLEALRDGLKDRRFTKLLSKYHFRNEELA